MKAIVCTRYGLKALKIRDVPKPVPGDGEVLVKISASAVNYAVMFQVKGRPIFIRFMRKGLFKPKPWIPGGEIAGRIEATGANVTQFKPGDEVFGDTCNCGYGAFAEYVCAPENVIALKPGNLTLREAAAVPQSALVALQGLRAGRIRKGCRVLVYGASGGIGTFAVQIAKAFEAEVTGVCGPGNLDLVRSLGADHVVDYTKEDFAGNGRQYDLVLAVRGYRPVRDYFRALGLDGVYVMVGGSFRQIFQSMSAGPRLFRGSGRTIGKFTYTPDRNDFTLIRELIQSGSVRPVIDRFFSLEKAAEAFRYLGKGHARGRVVVTVEKRDP